jgi:hypothetical protein
MEMDQGPSHVEETFRQARSTASDAVSGAADTISGAADTIRDRFDEGFAFARKNLSKVGNPLPSRNTLERAQSSLTDIFERQPLVLGAIGLAIGVAVAGALQTTEVENEWVGELSYNVKEDLSTQAGAVARRTREAGDTL